MQISLPGSLCDTIVNRRDGLETPLELQYISYHLCFCFGLCRNEDLYRHVLVLNVL